MKPNNEENKLGQRNSSLLKGCTAVISVSYDSDLHKLIVSKCKVLHNHHLGQGLLQYYPFSQQLNQTEQVEVNLFLNLKPSNKHLKEHFKLSMKSSLL